MDNNLVGKTIQGRYYVVRELGRGGVGVTFLAQDKNRFGDECVVKLLKPKNVNPKTLESARTLFEREAKIMKDLGHCDRIPSLLAYCEQDQEFFLVQDLIEGHDLSQEIIAGQPWSESQTLAMLQDVLEVLVVVQQNSVIHRDLKPSNLMRRQNDNKIVLIDFGSVKQVSTQIIDTAGQVKNTVAVGTKYYMPMEQIIGRPGFYSDIYALGIIAIEALTGVDPRDLTLDGEGEIIWRNLLNLSIHYQPRFLNLLDQMVRYRYEERYQSAEAVLADLQKLNNTQINDTLIIPRQTASAKTQKLAPLRQQNPEESVSNSNKPSIPKEVKLPAQNDQGKLISQGSSVKFPPPFKASQKIKSRTNTKSKILPLILGLLALLTAVGSWFVFSQRTKEPKLELSLYENYTQGFRVDYPQNWTKQNRDDFWATGAVFSSPLENDTDNFKEQVSVLVENLPQNISLAEYTKQSLSEIKQLSDPNIGEAQPIILGANEGRQIIYHGEENGNSVQRMQTWSVDGKRAYVITYTAIPESYDDYLPTVRKMIKSFEPIK